MKVYKIFNYLFFFRLDKSFGGNALDDLPIQKPSIEELSWRGYGMDSLRSPKKSLLYSSMVFAILWGLWHVPLFFVKDYYHYQIYQLNPLFGVNFFLALFPTAVILNWIYYRTYRNIFIIIIFHAVINLFGMLWQIEQTTKCLVTLLLTILATLLVFKEKKLFLEKAS